MKYKLEWAVLARNGILSAIALIWVLPFCSFSGDHKGNVKIRKVPVYKMGTFWKERHEQLETMDGQKVNNNTVNTLTVIDGESTFNGDDIYTSTVVNPEERKFGLAIISKLDLKLHAFISLNRRRRDTITTEFKLLDFPLFKGKKWKYKCIYQEFHDSKLDTLQGAFEVFDIRDTVLKLREKSVKTQAFFLRVKFASEKRPNTFYYTYLKPTQKFPGSNPSYMLIQMMERGRSRKTGQLIWKHSILDYNG